MGCLRWVMLSGLFMAALTASFCVALTDLRDVAAMNSLWFSLNFPPLLGWVPIGGDPCGEEWQGVSCVFSNITALKLNGMNLGGSLDSELAIFQSIIEIDLSNNHIGGSIPSELPPTLSSLLLNNNHLTGKIPDAFQLSTSLTNLDLSGNNLSGQLPPSLGNLSSLTTLHLQNNQLAGFLDVLKDLPLQDLNIENNLFSGPIPAKLLSIPNFKKDGNPFNTTIIPSPPLVLPPSPSPSPSISPSPEGTHEKKGHGQPTPITPGDERAESSSKSSSRTKRFIGIVVPLLSVFIISGACLIMFACRQRKRVKGDTNRNDVDKGQVKKPTSEFSSETNNERQKDNGKLGINPKLHDEQGISRTRISALSRNNMDHVIDTNFMPLQSPPPPPSCLPVDKVIANPIEPEEAYITISSFNSLKSINSVTIFTIATLQQYTNSFSEENFVGEGSLGSVYKAELSDGKLLAVKKLNSMAIRQQTDKEFLDLVSTISKIRHANIVELVGYSNEHNQRLLVYEYYETGTLHDALHVDDEIHKKLSWNVRIRLVLGTATALQYLHEVCQPPIVHQNFRSGNILLDEKLVAFVSDCGLAGLQSSSSASELAGYCAPEFQFGSYTCKSDVYSFGVVMLELLTGRKSYDRSRSRGEQSLVRWAIPRLHDIDSLSGMVDPSLKGAYPVKSLSRFADIISKCIQWEPEFRPAMSEVVQDLLCML